jgi:hypothetical protein
VVWRPMVGRWGKKGNKMSKSKLDVPSWVTVRILSVQYFGPTETKGSRFRVVDVGGWGPRRLIKGYRYELGNEENRAEVAKVLAGEGWEPVGVVEAQEGETLHVFQRKGGNHE